MKNKIWLKLYYYALSIYAIFSTSFLYNQFLTIMNVNITQRSSLVKMEPSLLADFLYLIKDNNTMIFIFGIVLISILSNLFYIAEFLVFSTREEIKIKRIVGYTYKDVIKDYYLKFISEFLISISAACLTCIPILYYQDNPIIIPILIAFISIFILLSILIISILVYCMNKYKNGKVFGFKYAKKMIVVLQFSTSLILVFVGITMFIDVNQEISPYKNYAELENAWILRNDTTGEQSYEIDQNPEEYHTNLLGKIENIYTNYFDNMIVYYPSGIRNKDIGSVVHLSEKAWELNNIDIKMFEPYLDSNYVPIVLNGGFYGTYQVGDIIENGEFDYVVAKVLKDGEIMKVLGPIDYGEHTSKSENFALFNNIFISRELRCGNTNFLNNLFFYDTSAEIMQDINDYIDQPNLKYTYESIKDIQQNNYDSKMDMLSAYFMAGFINLVFSLMGLVFITYVDINSRETEFSIMKVVGYTNKYISAKYLSSIIMILISSFLIAMLITYYTLRLSMIVTIIVIMIVLIVLGVISYNSIKFIKDIKVVEIIGGENV